MYVVRYFLTKTYCGTRIRLFCARKLILCTHWIGRRLLGRNDLEEEFTCCLCREFVVWPHCDACHDRVHWTCRMPIRVDVSFNRNLGASSWPDNPVRPVGPEKAYPRCQWEFHKGPAFCARGTTEYFSNAMHRETVKIQVCMMCATDMKEEVEMEASRTDSFMSQNLIPA